MPYKHPTCSATSQKKQSLRQSNTSSTEVRGFRLKFLLDMSSSYSFCLGRGIEDSLERFEFYAIGFALRTYLSELPEPLLGVDAFDKVSTSPDLAVEAIISNAPKVF